VGSLAVALLRSASPEPEVAKRMLHAAPHRGTKSEVVVQDDAVLGIAADPAFNDASLARDDGLVAAFAGSLDNRLDVNAEISRARVQVVGDSPAATVLAAFRAWGDDAVSRLRGTFVGAVSDGRSIQCFRDHCGWQTLFYRHDERGFFAASEVKQVLAGADVTRHPDLAAVTDIFYSRLQAGRTAVKGVARFPVASVAKVDRHQRELASRRYWDPTSLLETARVSVPEAREQLAELLDQAVARIVSGRDAIGLSGGVDSPTLAAFAAPRHLEIGGEPLTAVSAVYPDYPTVDETHYIELVAKHLGLRLHTYVQRASALEDLAFWVDALDGPWDLLPVQQMAEMYGIARELGARQLITGEMAEPVMTMAGPLFGHVVSHGRMRAAARWLAASRARGRSVRAIGREVAISLMPTLVASGLLRLRSRELRARKAALAPTWVDLSEVPGIAIGTDFSLPIRRRWEHNQVGPALVDIGPNQEADDLCGARLGVQIRLPFSDIDLWEFFLSLPAEVKFPDFNAVSKRLVRDAMRGRLPDELLNRMSKTNFTDHIIGNADYAGLERWIVGSDFRVEGVDYPALAGKLERRELDVDDVVWAQDLARVHAFVSLFE